MRAAAAKLKVVVTLTKAWTWTLADVRRGGTYRATVLVPPGGFGSLEIGMGTQRFTVTNPPKR